MNFISKISLFTIPTLVILMTGVIYAESAISKQILPEGNNLPTTQSTHKKIPSNTLLTTAAASQTEQPKLSSNTPTRYFARIKDQIIPIDTTTFSAERTVLEYSQDSHYQPEIENINICSNDKSIITSIQCDLTTTFTTRFSVKRKVIFEVSKSKLESYLEDLNTIVKKKPTNVKLKADKSETIIVTRKEIPGYQLDIKKITNEPLRYFGNLATTKIVALPTKTSLPIITSDNYKELGISKKIGHGVSNFRGSPKNRIHNIHNATSKFEGILIPPGEVFSFVKNLGDVNESTGYKEELVIKDNKTIPEFGGGVCQVSTTLFRSAVNTGLEITERRNHAYPVQYYSPQGTDATIYIPKPDLQFKNNTSKYIMLQPHIEGTILTFDIFGTPDGRQVETEGPTLLKRGDDGSKKYVWWQIVNDKDGNQISKKGFWSYYQDAAKFHGDGNQNTKLTSKPKNWSSKEWKKYKREHGM